MEFFHETNQEKFLWLGFNEKYGWVILDRLLPANKSGQRKGEFLYFIKCSDWTIYKEQRSKWEYPEYTFVVIYLENIIENSQKEIEKKAIELIDNPTRYIDCPDCGHLTLVIWSPKNQRYFLGCSEFHNGCAWAKSIWKY